MITFDLLLSNDASQFTDSEHSILAYMVAKIIARIYRGTLTLFAEAGALKAVLACNHDYITLKIQRALQRDGSKEKLNVPSNALKWSGEEIKSEVKQSGKRD